MADIRCGGLKVCTCTNALESSSCSQQSQLESERGVEICCGGLKACTSTKVLESHSSVSSTRTRMKWWWVCKMWPRESTINLFCSKNMRYTQVQQVWSGKRPTRPILPWTHIKGWWALKCKHWAYSELWEDKEKAVCRTGACYLPVFLSLLHFLSHTCHRLSWHLCFPPF